MGLNEMLLRPKGPKQNPDSDSLGALGMAEPTELHWNLANLYSKVINSHIFDNNIIVGVESVTKYANTYRVYDVVAKRYRRKSDILKNIPAETLFVIEISHSGNVDSDKEKIFEAWKMFHKIEEAFVYDYDEKIWHRFQNGIFTKSGNSEILSVDFEALTINYLESLQD